MSGLVTLGWTGFAGTVEGGGGGGPSGIVIPFTLWDADGELASSVDLSGAGVVKISVNGDTYTNIVGDPPEPVLGRSGEYIYVLDDTEVPPDGGYVRLSVVLAGYQLVMEDCRPTLATAGNVSSSTSTTAANISNAISAINATISSAITNINTNTNTQVADLPTAAEIDTLLSANHGAGSWAGATAAEILLAILDHNHDTGVTVGGLLARIEAVLTGKATGLSDAGTGRYYMRDGVTIAVQSTIDPAAGTRGPSDVSGSE